MKCYDCNLFHELYNEIRAQYVVQRMKNLLYGEETFIECIGMEEQAKMKCIQRNKGMCIYENCE